MWARDTMGWALATHGAGTQGLLFMPWLRGCQFLTCGRLWYVLKLLSGLCLVDSEAKKACSTQAETNQRHIYMHTALLHIHVLCIMSISSNSSCWYIIAPVNPCRIVTDTCNCVLVWLSLYYSLLLKAVRKGRGDKLIKNWNFEGNIGIA